MFSAPFFHVGFADFWLADQLNSLVTALMDLQYLICFYFANFFNMDGTEGRRKRYNLFFNHVVIFDSF